jgi:hypothetical protein
MFFKLNAIFVGKSAIFFRHNSSDYCGISTRQSIPDFKFSTSRAARQRLGRQPRKIRMFSF